MLVKYRVTMPCYVRGTYVDGSAHQPAIIDFNTDWGIRPNPAWVLVQEEPAPPKAEAPAVEDSGPRGKRVRANDQTPI